MTKRAVGPGRRVERRRIQTIIQDSELVEERHEQIFRAATRIFVSRGYDRATVREIAEEAGLSLGSLYTYIKTKEDILYLVFEKLTGARRENIRRALKSIQDPAERVEAVIRGHLEIAERYQDEVLLMYQETKSLSRESLVSVLSREGEYIRFVEEILHEASDQSLIQGDPRLSADIITFLCSIVALRRWTLRRRFAPAEAVDGLVAFILRGLGVATGAGPRPRPPAGEGGRRPGSEEA